MAIRFFCPHCGREYRVEDRHAGKIFPCKKCQCTVEIPEPEEDDLTDLKAPEEAVPVAVLEESDPVLVAQPVGGARHSRAPRRRSGRRGRVRRKSSAWIFVVLGIVGVSVLGCCLFTALLGTAGQMIDEQEMRELDEIIEALDEIGKNYEEKMKKLEEQDFEPPPDFEPPSPRAEIPPERAPDEVREAPPREEPKPRKTSPFEGSIFLFEFKADGEWHRAGHAFAVFFKVQRRKLILTAHHLFGTAGGLDDQIPPGALCARVLQYSLHEAVTDKTVVRGGNPVVFKTAYPFGPDERGLWKAMGDVAAFWGPDPKEDTMGVLLLARVEPNPGQPVWLACQTPYRSGKPIRKIKGKVAEANICGMYVEYEEKFDIKGTSGAPVLNHKDEVVGIHVGQARTRDGRMLAMANPISSIHTHLHLALEKE